MLLHRLFSAPYCLVLLLLLATAAGGRAQNGAPAGPTLTIELPPGFRSEQLSMRYVLAGEDLGHWLSVRAGVSQYVVSTRMRSGLPARGIRAILAAPECALQTIDLPLPATGRAGYEFVCRPVRSSTVSALVREADWLLGRELEVEARYLVPWAPQFLQLAPHTLVSVPVARGIVFRGSESEGQTGFRVTIPDWVSAAATTTAATASENGRGGRGEFQFWVRDRTDARIVAHLVPTGQPQIRTTRGGLAARAEYGVELSFVACAVEPSGIHDRFGFARRPGLNDVCGVGGRGY